MADLIDMLAQTYGRLTVEARAAPHKDRRARWVCRCTCGNLTTVIGKNLRNGTTRSCGCLMVETSRALGANPAYAGHKLGMLRHGHKRRGKPSLEYKTWLGMKRRCTDEKTPDYTNYGARGIRVCERWDASFDAFLEDMGPRPTPTHQIDRLNPNGNYEPANCRWATPLENNSENKRGILAVSIRGMTFPSQSAACRHFGVGFTTFQERLKRGVTFEKALTTPGRLQRPRTRESYLPKDHPDRQSRSAVRAGR